MGSSSIIFWKEVAREGTETAATAEQVAVAILSGSWKGLGKSWKLGLLGSGDKLCFLGLSDVYTHPLLSPLTISIFF